MILLTGASGFIGKHLLNNLVEAYGHDKIVALTSQKIEGILCVEHAGYNFDRDIFIDKGFENIETLIHAGSFTPKNSNEANNIRLSNQNIRNTEVLLNAHLPNLKRIIFLSAIDVYNTDSIITEQTPENPISIYAHSKLYSEKMIENWVKQNDKIVQILRIGHVYGPGEESYAKLIPETFRKVLSNQTISIYGTGEELRSYIYIKDVTKAIIKALTFDVNLGIINLAGSQPISTLKLINKIKLIAHSDVTVEKIETDFKGKNVIFDNSKMLKFLLDEEIELSKGLQEEYTYLKQSFKAHEPLL